MNCPTCLYPLENGTYVCTETDYRILDSNNRVEPTLIVDHNIDSDDEEIGDSQNIKYCLCGYRVEVD
tara:strand:+ start:97 stop:297 length:201 start_codon:yes stop_codon:yes gene_type:complete